MNGKSVWFAIMRSCTEMLKAGAFMLACYNLSAAAAVLTVTNTADSGAGSLRQAILTANTTPGPNSIRFNLPGAGVQTITPQTALPDLTRQVVIDGYTQPGSSPNTLTNGNNAALLIRLDGTNLPFATPALKLNGTAGNLVRGLVIVRAYTGIQLYACSSSVIAGNWIGLDVDNIARGGNGVGVDVTCAVFNRSTGNLIGGTTPADRNVIAGFWTGIQFFPFSADHNSVQGNFIGTDATGSLPRGNLFEGVQVQSATNIQIGGSSPAARNLIAASQIGVNLLGSSSNVIQGNFIGTDVTGRYDLGNSQNGITVQGCVFTSIGGVNAGNLIANNTQNGISFLGSTNAVIQGNWIGTDPTGAWPMGNGWAGISLQNSGSVLVGGSGLGMANLIEFNTGDGVAITYGQNHTVSANSIYDNGGLGINLGTGANQAQVSPLINGVVVAYGSTTVQGQLNGQAGTAFRIECFASPQWDLQRAPEGRLYLGATSATTDGSGNANFAAALPVAAPTNLVVTATATDPAGNTSEFSAAAFPTYGPQAVKLSLVSGSGVLVISWPSAAGALGFQLQATASLSSAAWQPVTVGIKDDGTVQSLTLANAPSPSSQFFRLAR